MTNMLSRGNVCIIELYTKGYRVDNGEVISPYSGMKRKLYLDRYNYYKFNYHGFPVLVHRLLAYQKYGILIFEKGIEVRHLDNNSLNNSEDNITIGTKTDNMCDMPESSRLERSIHASTYIRKFTDEEMVEIRTRRKQGNTYKELMEEFDISSKGTLHYILNKKYVTKK